MASPDHLKGINSLPRWDPNNPTKYNYDPKNYDAADYAAFKQARLEAQGKAKTGSIARFEEIIKQANKVIADTIKETKKGMQGKKSSRDQVEQWAKSGHRLYADVPSECFAELSWKADPDGDGTDGTVHAEFNKRNPNGGYDYDVDLDTFMAWTSDSLGEFFNAEIR